MRQAPSVEGAKTLLFAQLADLGQLRALAATMASCCCFSRSIRAVSRLATAAVTREPPSSHRGTLVLATLPRVIAVREISLAVIPSALFSSTHVIRSYFAGLTDPPIDEQPATRHRASTGTNAGRAIEINFMSATSLSALISAVIIPPNHSLPPSRQRLCLRPAQSACGWQQKRGVKQDASARSAGFLGMLCLDGVSVGGSFREPLSLCFSGRSGRI